MYIMFIVHSWPAFCHAANKRRLIEIDWRRELIKRWDGERQPLYDGHDNAHVLQNTKKEPASFSKL